MSCTDGTQATSTRPTGGKNCRALAHDLGAEKPRGVDHQTRDAQHFLGDITSTQLNNRNRFIFHKGVKVNVFQTQKVSVSIS